MCDAVFCVKLIKKAAGVPTPAVHTQAPAGPFKQLQVDVTLCATFGPLPREMSVSAHPRSQVG